VSQLGQQAADGAAFPLVAGRIEAQSLELLRAERRVPDSPLVEIAGTPVRQSLKAR
jgi:hypothetical protein